MHCTGHHTGATGLWPQEEADRLIPQGDGLADDQVVFTEGLFVLFIFSFPSYTTRWVTDFSYHVDLEEGNTMKHQP